MEFSLGGDENVLELDNDDDYTSRDYIKHHWIVYDNTCELYFNF